MHHLRFNIAGALRAIVAFAVGFAALREAGQLWDSWLFSLTLGLLLSAVLLAVHCTGDRRAFWIGFALFGWGYLSLSLIPSIEPRLIATKMLAYLYQSPLFPIRMYNMRAILAPDRMRANNVTPDDVRSEVGVVSGRVTSEPFVQLVPATGAASQNDGYVLNWVSPYNKPDQFGEIILRATPDGEILRFKDIARIELVSSFYRTRVGPVTDENFLRIGHTLFALLAAWLGGVLSRRLRIVAVVPNRT